MSIEDRVDAWMEPFVVEVASSLGLRAGSWRGTYTKPPRKEFGDLSSNAALEIASKSGANPREVAGRIAGLLPSAPFVERVEVAGPGFINVFLKVDWLYDVLREVVASGAGYGRAEPTGRSVQVEFVSANPTGPLHIGHARNAVIGDAVANVMEATGWRVEREYYFNDAGRQMDLFGSSVEARYLELFGRQAEIPEDGYRGEYVVEVAKDIAAAFGDSLTDLPSEERHARSIHEGAERVLAMIEATLERFGVRFDSFFSERTLHESGEIEQAVGRLRAAGLAYDSEGAVFFRSTSFGDDKDRVLIRSNGAPTYFAADCAYVIDKFARGFDLLIYVWGADHHGDVVRVKGAAEALGYDPESLEMVLYQWVSLSRGGEPVGMSKRAGAFVTLDELIDEVGADATRFTLLLRSNDSTLDFDIEAVKRQTMDNPVYYVQYGHARIASILRRAEELGVALRPVEEADLSLLSTNAELDLLRLIADLPSEVEHAAEHRAPHRLTHYAQDLAARFHRFYTECRVISQDAERTQARLWLALGTKQVLATALALIGVGAPESMERMERIDGGEP